jgi:hypothetical protein
MIKESHFLFSASFIEGKRTLKAKAILPLTASTVACISLRLGTGVLEDALEDMVNT